MGQLGLGNTSTEVGYPTQVQNLSGVTLTSLGGSHSCALVKDGSIACWGDNTNVQLGVRDSKEPVRSGSVRQVSEMSFHFALSIHDRQGVSLVVKRSQVPS